MKNPAFLQACKAWVYLPSDMKIMQTREREQEGKKKYNGTVKM